jgi:hypothetical protein
MTRYVLEVETDNLVQAMEVLNKSGMDAQFSEVFSRDSGQLEKSTRGSKEFLEDADPGAGSRGLCVAGRCIRNTYRDIVKKRQRTVNCSVKRYASLFHL